MRMNCKFWLFNVPDSRAEFQDGTSFDGRQIGQDFVLFHAVQLVGILTEHHGFDAGLILLPIGQHGLSDITWNKLTTTIKTIFKRDNRKHFGTYCCSFCWWRGSGQARGRCYETLSVFVDEPWVERWIICPSEIYTTRLAQLQSHTQALNRPMFFSRYDPFGFRFSIGLDANHF